MKMDNILTELNPLHLIYFFIFYILVLLTLIPKDYVFWTCN